MCSQLCLSVQGKFLSTRRFLHQTKKLLLNVDLRQGSSLMTSHRTACVLFTHDVTVTSACLKFTNYFQLNVKQNVYFVFHILRVSETSPFWTYLRNDPRVWKDACVSDVTELVHICLCLASIELCSDEALLSLLSHSSWHFKVLTRIITGNKKLVIRKFIEFVTNHVLYFNGLLSEIVWIMISDCCLTGREVVSSWRLCDVELG